MHYQKVFKPRLNGPTLYSVFLKNVFTYFQLHTSANGDFTLWGKKCLKISSYFRSKHMAHEQMSTSPFITLISSYFFQIENIHYCPLYHQTVSSYSLRIRQAKYLFCWLEILNSYFEAFMSQINIPLVLINSEDDPIIPTTLFKYAKDYAGQYIYLYFALDLLLQFL